MEVLEVLEVLNKYAASIQVLATIGLLIATVVLYYTTKKMARSSNTTSEATKLLADESRRLREDAKKPQMSVKLQPLAEHGDFIQLVLNNLGQGAALNVKFRLEGDEEDFKSHEISLRGGLSPINFMSQGESEIYELGLDHTLFADPPMKPFSVVINYEDVDGQSYEKRIVLDVKQFKGLEWSGASVAWRQMSALEGIAKHFWLSEAHGRMRSHGDASKVT